MEIRRNTPTVVLNRNRVIFVDIDFDIRTISGQCLVYRVVHHLVDQVVQPFYADVPDVHGRALADRFEPFEYLDTGRRIFFFNHFFVFCAHLLCL